MVNIWFDVRNASRSFIMTASPQPGQGITKAMRLRRRAEFLDVQSSGRKVHGRYVLAMCKVTSPNQPGRVGFTITKKIGNAAVRNRLRRVMREWLRTHGWVPAGKDIVFVAKPVASVGGVPVDAKQLVADLQRVVTQL